MITRFAITIKDATAPANGIPLDATAETYVFELPIEAIRLLKNIAPASYCSASLSFVNDEPVKELKEN